MTVITGLEALSSEISLQNKLTGQVAYLCHSASIDRHFQLGVFHLQKILGKRLVKLFGPQHGFVTDVQDNMIESQDYIHPYFKIPVHSLYSTTRIPTQKMLEGVDTFVVDLQDVGTRVYTYITTLALTMKACQEQGIKVVVLDRPNPVGGEILEGAVLKKEWASFVGHHEIPQRHGMTMGEVALYTKKFHNVDCELEIIKMKGYERSMFWCDTGLPWVNPSPNLPTPESALTFVGTVLFEGTNLSEGRGTTRSLEMIGHPAIEPFSLAEKLTKKMKEENIHDVALRPTVFLPTFQKHANTPCGGFHIHPLDLKNKKKNFRPWKLGQFLCRELKQALGSEFKWRETPYEYEYDRLAIDLINGTEVIRHWANNNGSMEELEKIEQVGMSAYAERFKSIQIYS